MSSNGPEELRDLGLEDNSSMNILPLIILPLLGALIGVGINSLIPDDSFAQNVRTILTSLSIGGLMGLGAMLRR